MKNQLVLTLALAGSLILPALAAEKVPAAPTAAAPKDAAPKPINLFPEGSFEITDDNGNSEGWKLLDKGYLQKFGSSSTFVVEDGNRFLRFISGGVKQSLWGEASLKLDPTWKTLRVVSKFRIKDIKVDPEKGWYGAQWDGQWKDKDGKYLKHVGTSMRLKADTDGWVEKEQTFTVVDGATTLFMNPGLWGSTGTLDLDDIQIFAE